MNGRVIRGHGFGASGNEKHGPTADKPQVKLWQHAGSWWAVMTRDPDVPPGIFRLGDDGVWLPTGDRVLSGQELRADVLWDGSFLWIAAVTTEGVSGEGEQASGLSVSRHRFAGGRWPLEDVPVELGGIASPSVTIAEDGHSGALAAFTFEGTVWSLAIDAHGIVHEPERVSCSPRHLCSEEIAAVARVDGESVIVWSDQETQSFGCAIAGSSGWRYECAASGPLIADDHVSLKVAGSRLVVAVKTSLDLDRRASPQDAQLLLLVREAGGEWHRHPVAALEEQVTRPVPIVDAAGGIHVVYSAGPKERREIRVKSSRLARPEFTPGPGRTLIGWDGATINDVTAPREPIGANGLVLLASDPRERRYYHFEYYHLAARSVEDAVASGRAVVRMR